MTRNFMSVMAAGLFVLLNVLVVEAATPKEAVGFFGTVTGVVKSAKADGTSFVLKVTSAVADEKTSAIKDTAPMVGKEITLGTRMPKKDGKPFPHEDDVAYIKSLKAGDTISIKVFAVRSDPSVLRMTAPGQSATPAAPATPATPAK